MSMLAVVNPAAGHGRCGERVHDALARLRAAGVEVESVRTERPGQATSIVSRAYADGCRAFLAVGGDGTSFEIVNGLAERPERATLGFLPLGTGNSFLRDFTDDLLEHAIARITSGTTRPCDLMRLEHADGVLYSINLVSLGFPADVAEVTNRRFKRMGAFGYVLGVLACLARLPRRTFTLRVDGGATETARSLMLVFANSRFTGGKMMIAPQADPGDGLVECVRLGPIGRLTLLRSFRRLYDGSYVEMKAADRRGARRIEFDLEGPEDVMIDGEVARVHCKALSILPHALDVLA